MLIFVIIVKINKVNPFQKRRLVLSNFNNQPVIIISRHRSDTHTLRQPARMEFGLPQKYFFYTNYVARAQIYINKVLFKINSNKQEYKSLTYLVSHRTSTTPTHTFQNNMMYPYLKNIPVYKPRLLCL